MTRTSKTAAIIATLLAALAVGCTEPTSPRNGTSCSGGGTGTWDITCTAVRAPLRVDTAATSAKSPTP
ncbi:MAG: hypothetical protein ABI229_09390 [Gemmatimonadaceae bacterium]